MRLGLNGRFLAAPVTGVQRFALETGRRVLAAPEVDGVLFLPRGVEGPEGVFAGTEIVRGRASGHVWEQSELPFRARRAGVELLLNLANTVPLTGGPHLVVVHDVLPLSDPRWFGRGFRILYRQVQARAVRRARAVLTVSEWSRGEIARMLDLPAEEIRVVTQGLAPFDAPAPDGVVDRVRRRLSLPERYLLTVGGRDPRKNVPFLDTVLRRARERGLDVPPLVVVGPEKPPGRGRPVGGVPGDVRFTGYLEDDDLAALYTGAAAFCYPSLAEGFGRPPLEAMACGAPVITSDYGPAREVLGDGARILSWDADAWVEALRAVLDDPQARSRLSARGRERASDFSWDAAARAVLRESRRVTNGADSRGLTP